MVETIQFKPYTEFQLGCLELLSSTPRNWATNSFRSALAHLEAAEKLYGVDDAMCVFRSITAEEEAASGLIRVLQQREYPLAEKVGHKNHRHKHAVAPFFGIVGNYLNAVVSQHFKNYHLHIKTENGARQLALFLTMYIDGVEKRLYILPPLNFGMKEGKTALPPSFAEQINEFASIRGVADALSAIKQDANVRNKILYASPTGYPRLEKLEQDFIYLRRRRVFAMLNAFLLIEPHAECQLFVTIVLEAFVKMLGLVDQQLSNESSSDSS
jgi:hypothetical protein